MSTRRGGTNLTRHQLNERHTAILARWLPGVTLPSGLLADLANCTAGYPRTAARQAIAGSLFTLEETT